VAPDNPSRRPSSAAERGRGEEAQEAEGEDDLASGVGGLLVYEPFLLYEALQLGVLHRSFNEMMSRTLAQSIGRERPVRLHEVWSFTTEVLVSSDFFASLFSRP
jgi:hypothetical protein